MLTQREDHIFDSSFDPTRTDPEVLSSVAALAFDDWGASGVASKVCGGPTGTGRSNVYFVASLNGGAPGGPELHLGWHGPPLAPPVEPPLHGDPALS